MKPVIFWGGITALQALFLFLQIYQNSNRIQMQYALRKLEQSIERLEIEKNDLLATLCGAQSPDAVKRYAIEQLHFQPVTLKHIITVAREDIEREHDV